MLRETFGGNEEKLDEYLLKLSEKYIKNLNLAWIVGAGGGSAGAASSSMSTG